MIGLDIAAITCCLVLGIALARTNGRVADLRQRVNGLEDRLDRQSEQQQQEFAPRGQGRTMWGD